MRNRKLFRCLTVLVLLVSVLSTTVLADVPYESYNKTEWNTSVPAPEAYKPDMIVTGEKLNIGTITQPADFYMDKSGQLYVIDKKGRIVILDSNLRFIKEIKSLNISGKPTTLSNPSGIFVDGGGFIYIADTGNARGLKIDSNGNVLAQYLKPDSSAYTSSVFVPLKIMCDGSNSVYVLSQNVYQGLIVFSDKGKFLSYYGSSTVQLTLPMIADRMWKSVMSREQKQNLSKYVPTEFTNMDIDPKGFIYTCASYTTNKEEQIRKLNYLGKNVFPYTKDFGEKDVVYYKRQSVVSNFMDLEIAANDVLYALDSTRGRVYAFDQNGNRLYTFGTNGEVVGAFINPVAIESYGQYLYVLDAGKNSITRFVPTEYAQLINQAISLYTEGQYQEALEPWKKVLSMNSNYQLAYSRIGDTLLKLGQYKDAVTYFRKGYDREKESTAFAKYRSEFFRGNIAVVLIFTLIAILLLYFLTNRKLMKRFGDRFRKKKDGSKKNQTLTFMRGIFFKPVQTLDEMKFVRFKNWGMSAAILLSLFVVTVLKRQFYGFRFNPYDPDTLNIFIQLASTVFPFILFCVSNWAVCSISEGKGTIGEIVTDVSMSLMPYILFQAAGILLSNVLVLDEKQFFDWFLAVGTIWSVILVFQSIRIVHQYSGGKTVFRILMTLFGVVIILFIMLLLFTLFRQIYSFGYSIYSELMYR